LGGVVDVAAKYKFLTGRGDFDALLSHEMSPYIRYRLREDSTPLTTALRQNAEALRVNWPGYTSEVRYTDRVLRFPTLFTRDGIVEKAFPAVRSPNPALLYSSVTGDPGASDYFPLNAVRWLTPPREIAALVTDSGKRQLSAHLFHFGAQPRSMGAEFYLLEPGNYRLSLATADPNSQGENKAFEVTGPRGRIDFVLPARTLCLLRVEGRP
jgi:hypothetical protein